MSPTARVRMFEPPSPEEIESFLFPQWLEYIAVHNPDHIVFAHETALRSGELKTINWRSLYGAFINAMDYVAFRVDVSNLSGGEEPPVIAVLANLDTISFFSLTSGIWLTGAVPFLISTRNSSAAIAHLLKKTNASALFVSPDDQMQMLAKSAFEGLDEPDAVRIQKLATPTFDALFASPPREIKPLNLPSTIEMTSPALILHSSGSTAFPKPIVLTHFVLKQWANWAYEVESSPEIRKRRVGLHALPAFHAMAIGSFTGALMGGLSLGVFPPTNPPIVPSPDVYLQSAVATKSDIPFSVPRFLEIWAQDDDHVELLKSFQAVPYGGGPLARDVGDRFVKEGVKVFNGYGGTEFGLIVPYSCEFHEDWEWIVLSARTNPYLRPIDDEQGQYELVFLEGPNHKPSVFNFEIDGVKGYATNDVVAKHPTDPRRVKILGRVDDQIMLSTGEKTNPGPLEAIIIKNPLVSTAIMFGRGHDQNGIIVQPIKAIDPGNEAAVKEFRNKIWPSVEEANAFAPSHSRIFKEMILVANPAKPFRLTAKQTAIRKVALADYAEEIDALYEAIARSAQKDIPGPSEWTIDGVHDFIERVVYNVMEKQLGDEDDFFLHGGDSLQATWMRNAVLHALRESQFASRAVEVGQDFVYANPTIGQFTTAIVALVDQAASSATTLSTPADAVKNKIATMEALIAEFAQAFPSHRPDPSLFNGTIGEDSGDVVLVTGTTGALGAQLLATLLSTPDIRRVYAFNRPSDSGSGGSLQDRQRQAFLERGLDASLLDGERVVLVEGNTEKADLGVSEEVYDELRRNVTLIIHNAWRVNFVLQVSSFKPLLQGMRNLIDFALHSPRSEPPRIIFTSSVSVFLNWTAVADGQSPPESSIPAKSAVGNGYSESKYVAERILDAASRTTALRPIIVRIGQMTGTAKGAWNSTDWVPAIVRSGQVLGVLPDRSGNIAWFSLDLAARALLEFRTSPHAYLNLAHPTPYPWTSVLRQFSHLLSIPLVPYPAWLDKLKESSAADPGNKNRNPAAHLIPFFSDTGLEVDLTKEAPGSIPFMSLEGALACSESLRQAAIDAVDVEGDATRWVKHWKAVGLLD